MQTDTPHKSTSDECFAKALAAENAGDNRKADQWLTLAVKREVEEKGIPAAA